MVDTTQTDLGLFWLQNHHVAVHRGDRDAGGLVRTPVNKEGKGRVRARRDGFSGHTPGGGTVTGSLQYSCLENPMDRGAWRATVHGVAKSWT